MKKKRSKEKLLLTNNANVTKRNWRLVGITLFSMSLGLMVSEEAKADTVKNPPEATVQDSSSTVESEQLNTINVVTADSSKAASSTASTEDSSNKSDAVPVTGNSTTASSNDKHKAEPALETTPAQKAGTERSVEATPASEADNTKESSSSDSQVQSEKQASNLVRPAAKSMVKTTSQSAIKAAAPQPVAATTPEKGGVADYTYDDSKATAPETPWQKVEYKGLQYFNDPTRALNYDDPAYPPIPSAKGWSVYVYYYHANKKHGQGWMLLPQLDPNDASKGTKNPPDFEGDQDGGERINTKTGEWHYPGDPGYSAQDLMAAGVNTYVSIFPNLQVAQVNFIDDSTGKTLGVTQLNGRTEYTSTYHPDNKIAQLKKKWLYTCQLEFSGYVDL